MGFCKILSRGDPGINLGFLSILFLRTPQSIKHPQNLCGSKHSNPHSLLPIIPLVTKCGHLVSPIPGLQLSYWNMRAHLRGGSPQLLLVCGKQPAQSLSRTLVLPLQFYFFFFFFYLFFPPATVFLMPSCWLCLLGLLRGCSEEGIPAQVTCDKSTSHFSLHILFDSFYIIPAPQLH